MSPFGRTGLLYVMSCFLWWHWLTALSRFLAYSRVADVGMMRYLLSFFLSYAFPAGGGSPAPPGWKRAGKPWFLRKTPGRVV